MAYQYKFRELKPAPIPVPRRNYEEPTEPFITVSNAVAPAQGKMLRDDAEERRHDDAEERRHDKQVNDSRSAQDKLRQSATRGNRRSVAARGPKRDPGSKLSRAERLLRERGPMTSRDIAEALGINPHSMTGILSTLVHSGRGRAERYLATYQASEKSRHTTDTINERLSDVVYAAIQRCGPITSQSLAERTGRPPAQIQSTISSLVDGGYVVRVGSTRTIYSVVPTE